MRIATFNLENFDFDDAESFAKRLDIIRPQLQRIRADILCLQEVHAQENSQGARTLSALETLLTGTLYEGYEKAVTRSGDGDFYRFRNLVTLSRFPIRKTSLIRDSSGPRPVYQKVTAIPPDTEAEALQWERPVLHTVIDWGQSRVHVINLHMKSKLATSIPGQKSDRFTWKTVSAWAEGSFISSMKRVGQALQVRMAVDAIFEQEGTNARIIVCGDFNSDIHEVALKAIMGPVAETGNPEHAPTIMVPCENNIPESSRYSLLYLGKGEMIDHILASRGLMRYFNRAEIHNESLPDESGAFRTDDKFPESDHAPVIAEFLDTPVLRG